MLNKQMFLSVFLMAILLSAPMAGYAANSSTDNAVIATVPITEDVAMEMEDLSANAVAAYDIEGSLFQQITNLEQEKVLMELEKERAQLDLELDRLAAEKIKLHMEIDSLSGRAEQQQQELENAQAKLEAEAQRLEREKEALAAQTEELESRSATTTTTSVTTNNNTESVPVVQFDKKYRLINVIGAGNQLQATIQDLNTGQNKTISVGKVLDGYTVKSISVEDGIVFDNGDNSQTLNISKAD